MVYISDDMRYKFQIWDTAGSERFRTIKATYYRGSSIVVMVFDVTDENTFSHLTAWKDEVIKYTTDKTEILVVGNKNDLTKQRAVSVDKGEAWALQNDAFYLDFSAKEGSSKVFKSILIQV